MADRAFSMSAPGLKMRRSVPGKMSSPEMKNSRLKGPNI